MLIYTSERWKWEKEPKKYISQTIKNVRFERRDSYQQAGNDPSRHPAQGLQNSSILNMQRDTIVRRLSNLENSRNKF